MFKIFFTFFILTSSLAMPKAFANVNYDDPNLPRGGAVDPSTHSNYGVSQFLQVTNDYISSSGGQPNVAYNILPEAYTTGDNRSLTAFPLENIKENGNYDESKVDN